MSFPVRHEQQELLYCGLHAVNCVLPEDIDPYTKADFDAISATLAEEEAAAAAADRGAGAPAPSSLLSRLRRNPHRHLLPIGDYDADVILYAVAYRGLEAAWWDPRRPAPTAAELGLVAGGVGEVLPSLPSVPSDVVGFLLNRPSRSAFAWALRMLGSGRHWSAVKRVVHSSSSDPQQRFYDVDSKLPSPRLLEGGAEEAAELVRAVLAEGGTVIRVLRPRAPPAPLPPDAGPAPASDPAPADPAPADPALSAPAALSDPIGPPASVPPALAAQDLLAWAASKGADVSRIRVTDEGPERGGLCVWVGQEGGWSPPLPASPPPPIPASSPAITIPLHLALTHDSPPARAPVDAFVDALVQRGYPRSSLPRTLLTVLRLAYERSLGRASPWHPYVAALPPTAPGLLHAPDADAALVGTELAGLPLASRLAAERADMSERLRSLVDEEAGNKDGWLSPPSLAWAHSMFVSRALLVPTRGPAMVPVMDLCNHRPGALSEFTVGGGGAAGGGGGSGRTVGLPPPASAPSSSSITSSSSPADSSAAMFDFMKGPQDASAAKRHRGAGEAVMGDASRPAPPTGVPAGAAPPPSPAIGDPTDNHAQQQPPSTATLSLLLGRAAPAGSQLCINYGAKDNASLALYYGFCLADNALEELDVVLLPSAEEGRNESAAPSSSAAAASSSSPSPGNASTSPRLQVASSRAAAVPLRPFPLSAHAVPPGLLETAREALRAAGGSDWAGDPLPLPASVPAPQAWDADASALAFFSACGEREGAATAVWLAGELRQLAGELGAPPRAAALPPPLAALCTAYRQGLAKVAEESARLILVSLEVHRAGGE